MQQVFVAGVGAVSPAGWSAEALGSALGGPGLIPSQISVPGSPNPVDVRKVPPPSPRPAPLAHPRLRRASPVSQFGVAAGFEALGQSGLDRSALLSLGVVFSVMSGSVVYSRRFFEEVLRDPPTASPLLFPETVFNAPASHLSACAASTGPNYTVVGDAGMFVQALGIAADWIQDGLAQSVLVVGSEEADWTSAGALTRFSRKAIPAEGAGAVVLTSDPRIGRVRLKATTRVRGFDSRPGRVLAARQVAAELEAVAGDALWVDGWSGAPAAAGEARGRSVSAELGDGLGALGAWACVVACSALMKGEAGRAAVRVVGANQQAVGAVFETAAPAGHDAAA